MAAARGRWPVATAARFRPGRSRRLPGCSARSKRPHTNTDEIGRLVGAPRHHGRARAAGQPGEVCGARGRGRRRAVAADLAEAAELLRKRSGTRRPARSSITEAGGRITDLDGRAARLFPRPHAGEEPRHPGDQRPAARCVSRGLAGDWRLVAKKSQLRSEGPKATSLSKGPGFSQAAKLFEQGAGSRELGGADVGLTVA